MQFARPLIAKIENEIIILIDREWTMADQNFDRLGKILEGIDQTADLFGGEIGFVQMLRTKRNISILAGQSIVEQEGSP